MTTVQPILNRTEIHQRLQIIFPEGTPHRGYCTRELAASTVFAALYVGAIEGSGVFFGPKYVYAMTFEQSELTDDASRADYAANVRKSRFEAVGRRWYRDTTRESIRDETLREGFVAVGAVVEKTDVPTTSSLPRYALTASFAALFDPALDSDAFAVAAADWQAKTLNTGAFARISLVRRGASAGGTEVRVTFPNGDSRGMKPGPSSEITKAVIEVFAPHFLQDPAVLFLSESGNKVVTRDDLLAKSIGLTIRADKNLPDAILVDLGPQHPLLVFVEIVATDGPINERRKQALERLATDAGFPLKHTAFVTAFLDRSSAPFKKSVDTLAWGSYAWFVSEPEGLVELSNDKKGLT
ncbi:BsuBI/PstI family type II restriction endonuclease [Bradyrhizobium sp.]|uniref:BsuBI/PstI family type II restriction endonuclease n=1 Tax=Bradyrhizobium sp. TaxID=376 RepID=UPI003C73F21E